MDRAEPFESAAMDAGSGTYLGGAIQCPWDYLPVATFSMAADEMG